ncbi:MAG: universal stress protein [Chloroflexota bacterium]|nr:MAG: universal stress protein [Chloroflexota bacterium]
MKRLLIGYDGSDQAREAARTAGRLGVVLGAKVTVVTVGQIVLGQMASAAGTTVVPSLDERAFLPIAEDGAAIVRGSGVEADVCVLLGEPASKLIEVAAREGHDLVVVGHCGLGGLKGLVLGSVAKKVATEAPCPVLVVRGTAPEVLKNILVAVDGSELAEQALKAAATLAKAFAAGITLVHVVFPPLLNERKLEPAARRLRPTPEEQVGREALARAREICARMEVGYDSMQLGVDCESVLSDGPPSEVIPSLARSGVYDMVAVGRRGMSGVARLLLGSVSEEVLARGGALTLVAGKLQGA